MAGKIKDFKEKLEGLSIPVTESGCFLWIGTINKNGYGKLSYSRNGKRYVKWAHRVSYETYVGKIPEGLDLDHKCRVRCCINPNHLEPVTRSENSKRGISGEVVRERRKNVHFCKNGHLYSDENVRKNKHSNARVCKECQRLAMRRYRERQKAKTG